MENQQVITDLKTQQDINNEATNDAYPFIFLESAPSMAGSGPAKLIIQETKGLQLDEASLLNGWDLYTQALVSKLQSQLKQRLSREILTKQLQPLFSYLLSKRTL